MLHVASDIMTGLAYYAISSVMFYFVYKRRDLPFLSMFLLFGIFIFACGTTHLFSAVTVYVPAYWQEGVVKAFTAIISVFSAILLIPLIPKAIALPSLTKALDEIKVLNSTLEKQVEELRIKDSAIASSSNAIAFAGLDGRLSYANSAFLALWGYGRKEEVLGRPVSVFWGPEENAVNLKETLRTAGNWAGELAAKRKDGNAFITELTWSTVLDESGEPLCLMGLFTDITERKKTEESIRNALKRVEDEKARSEAIIAAIGDGLSIQDTDFKILYQNQIHKNLIGDHVGEPCYAIYEGRDHCCEGCPVAMSFKDGSIHTVERTVSSERGPRYFDITSSPLRDSSGNIIAGIEAVREITERKGLEAQLRHAQKMEAIGTLTGGIAHDFNNILNIILGYGYMVMDSLGNDHPALAHMNEVLAAGDRAADLTKRLLAFSRKQPPDFVCANVRDIITGVVKMLSRIIGEDVELVMRLADEKMQIMADIGQVEQVLMNIAANARDAMPDGGSLTISTEMREIDDAFVAANGYGAPGKYVLISLTDTGAGINAENQSRVFEPFFTTKGIGEGTGLGLSIAYGIIKQHSGYIKVYSETGMGTTFKLFLPLVEKTKDIVQKTAELKPPRGGTETVLLAEDNLTLRNLTRVVLESSGYRVIAAEDGEDAIAKFREHEDAIQLLVFDLIMPKKNGKEAYEEIKKSKPGIKTLFMSGYSLDIISKKDMLDQGVDILPKPVLSKDLLKKVREILDK